MEAHEIKEKIESFPSWHQQFNLRGNLTADRKYTRDQSARKRYFFDPLVDLFGGTLRGRRVLDLGCNAGFWSLCCIENDCDFVVGIDGRQVNIDQANFVFHVSEVESRKYEFVMGNVLDRDFAEFGDFDVVLCLGLLYHISKPMELLEKIARVNSDILLIDTAISRAPGSYLRILHERIDSPVRAVDYSLVMRPTKLGVLDLVAQFGYSAAILNPPGDVRKEMAPYRFGFRRAFMCTKQTDLSNLSTGVETVRVWGEPRDIVAEIAHRMVVKAKHRLVTAREGIRSALGRDSDR